MTCDDACVSPVVPCGGNQLLNREVVQMNNKNGVVCPRLQYPRVCGQIKCPINCDMSSWSGWTMCTKECEGGVQQRTRNIVEKPLNGGDSCDTTQEARGCNTGSCDRDCDLKKWTEWTPCSQACDGGFQEKVRRIKRPIRGNGKCPKKQTSFRYEKQKCNIHACVGDEICIAAQDTILAIDGSGSLRESGFEVLKDFAKALVRRFSGQAYEREAMKVAVVQFGNGMIMKDGTISPAKIIAELDDDMEKIGKAIDTIEWEKGFTNMAQAFVGAEKVMMNSGRKRVQSTILVITDGKPSFRFQTYQEVMKVRSKGVKVIMVPINAFPSKDNRAFTKKLASIPWETNMVPIPGVKKLKREMDHWVTETIVQSCPEAESPGATEMMDEEQGFKLIREGAVCGADPKDPEGPAARFLLGTVDSPGECFGLALEMEAMFFSFGTEEGYNLGKCYQELTESVDCPEEWESTSADFYEISFEMSEGMEE